VTESTPAVGLRGITKVFGSVRANNAISLDIHAGRIKALLGENGAGKSTLMSILAGHYLPDAGEILIDGRPCHLRSTKDAIKAGIGMVYQHFMLVEAMTVAENVFLGQEPGFLLSPKAMQEQVRALGAAFGLDVDPDARVADLSMGEKQRVEILKLLQRESRILIFDEPTAVLTPQESEQLFAALRSMAAQGKAIVYISHKLGEVMALADEIAILRKGEVVDEVPAAEVHSQSDLARRMVGREVLWRSAPPVDCARTCTRGGVRAHARASLTCGRGDPGRGRRGRQRSEGLVETVLRLGRRITATSRSRQTMAVTFSPPRLGRRLSYNPEERQVWPPAATWPWWTIFLFTTRQGLPRPLAQTREST
jgi:simple sugar transport system ATP-binding protein